MHGWDILTPSNYDQHQGWGPYRTEPRDYSVNLKQIKTESSPTSPLSMESNEFSNHTMFFNEHHHMAQGMTPLGQMQQRPIAFNPLTPPGYPNPTMHAQPLLNTPQSAVPLQEQSTPATPFRSQYPVANNLTPSYTPPMDVTPPKSPKYTMDGDAMLQKDEMHELNSNSGEDTRSMDSDHDDLRTPKVNSHGKVKTFKCKQCSYVAVTKLSFWEHTESHIPLEKRLKCPKCPFVTEFKHHLEYHLHNHDGSKPFQCPQCIYSCVNKSMLNSHLKSHSNVKKYNCADCNYATKYCHSLKLHLRKNGHKPGTVFNMDGTIDPSPVIDVHGRRRGPKTKSSGSKRSPAKTAEDGQQPSRRRKLKSESQFNETEVMQPQDLSPATQQQQQQFQSMMPSMLQNPFANIFNNHQHHNFPLFPYLNFNIQMLAAQQQAAFGQLSPNMQHESQNMHSPVHSRDEDENSSDDDDDASFKGANQSVELKSISSTAAVTSNDQEKVDLSNNNEPHRINEKRELVEAVAVKPTIQQQQQPGTPSSGKNKRKGRAFKLDMMKEAECDDDDVEVSTNTSRQEQHPISKEAEAKRETPTSSQQSDAESSSQPQSSTATQQIFECKYCEIAFKDALLYTIHMGYHGYNDVFTCNSCGEKCSDRVSFFLHIARSSHN